ncbi:MAG: family 78 glycoside hydrolase catalytic domain [Prolixibacteraceae bacterium]|nr:family 78 glycoside hydrolase catalytic domain [Prolixibacteraceae bacterium]
MKKILLLLCAFQFFATINYAQLQLVNLLTENRIEPEGIDNANPRLTWQLKSSERNVLQTAYEIRVSDDLRALKTGRNLSWQTNKIQSEQSVHISYSGKPLNAGTKYYWQVRVWDNHGNLSKWSEPTYWIVGMINPENWSAQWIQAGFTETELRPSPMFRKEFQAKKVVQSAIAFVTARGLYEAEINGNKIGNAFFTPGWTSYGKRIQYQTFDVTKLLRKGENAVGVTLGNGWYRGYLGIRGQRDFYGSDLALLFQLTIKYTDGTTEQVISDGSWQSATGPILYSELYHGETYDARLEKQGWSMPDYNDAAWSGVVVRDYPVNNLLATENELVKKQETLQPVKLFKTPKGEQVIDFGQNLVGWVQVKASGKAGDLVTLVHAEVLDKEGNFYTENLRSAKQKNTFILKGSGLETFEPHFSWQGFRYVKIENYPGELKPENFTAIVLNSDMAPTGNFICSDELVNQLQHNIQWGQKGNFVDVPTDCPQRDERKGWTGDAQAFVRTASFNFRVNSFFAKWMKDVAADQLPNGIVPWVVPDLYHNGLASPGWSDAATIVPWTMYLAYGDKQILADQYASMKAWVEYIRGISPENLWIPASSFGDWLFYRPADDNDGRSAVTDKNLIAQCFYACSTQNLIKAAEVLGNTADVNFYQQLLAKINEAFLKEYVTASGKLVSGTQTAYVLALNFDLLPENLRPQAAKRLVQNIRAYDTHLTTGFLGTPYLCQVLSRFGYSDVAYELLLQKSYPSWLYPVTMGATTIWERWDGIRPDGSFQTPTMNSFNHYAYGAIGDWMYREIAGIDTDDKNPGYKVIRIKPQIEKGLTHARAELETYYGKIVSAWNNSRGKLVMHVEIPANTTAEIYIPATDSDKISENGKPVNLLKDIVLTGKADTSVILHVGSGSYYFTVD